MQWKCNECSWRIRVQVHVSWICTGNRHPGLRAIVSCCYGIHLNHAGRSVRVMGVHIFSPECRCMFTQNANSCILRISTSWLAMAKIAKIAKNGNFANMAKIAKHVKMASCHFCIFLQFLPYGAFPGNTTAQWTKCKFQHVRNPPQTMAKMQKLQKWQVAILQ